MSEMLAVPGNRPNTPRAVDPDALGKIRNIVKSAHKWGGDGRRPKFRKIRRVLGAKHPEVIAKAFGGNADVAAAWIKNNWYRMRGMAPPPTRGKNKDVAAEVSLEWYCDVDMGALDDLDDADGEFDGFAELFMAIDQDVEAEGDSMVWTPILRTGHWASSPIIGRHDEPWDCTLQDLQQIEQAFNEKAWEFVTVPASKTGGSNHIQDPVYANTGFVEAVMIRPHSTLTGEHVLWGKINFTERDALQLVKNGTVRGVSVNVKFNVRNQETGKVYPKALAHVCLTNTPFATKLGAFQEQLAATRDPEKAAQLLELVSMELAQADPVESDFDALAEIRAAAGDIAYDQSTDFDTVRYAIQQQLDGLYIDNEGDVAPKAGGKDSAGQAEDAYSPAATYSYEQCLYVRGMTPDTALVCAGGSGDSGWAVGYDVNGKGDVTIDPPDEWVKVQQEWVQLSRFFAPTEELHLELEAELEDWDDGIDVWEPAPEDDAELAKPAHVTSTHTRKMLAKRGIALPDGSFPIPNVDFLKRAIRAIGRAKDRAKAIAHIKKRARALGATSLLPSSFSAEVVPFDGIILVNDDSLEGGAQMAGENNDGEVRMSRDQLSELMAEAIRKDREDRGPDPELVATREQVAELQASNHRLNVNGRVQKLNEAKLPPAFVKKAKELMLSPLGRSTEEITLTREPAEEGGEPTEVKLTFLEAIEELAATVPAALDSEDPTKGLKKEGGPDGGGKTPDEIAAEIMKDLEEGEVALVDADLTL